MIVFCALTLNGCLTCAARAEECMTRTSLCTGHDWPLQMIEKLKLSAARKRAKPSTIVLGHTRRRGHSAESGMIVASRCCGWVQVVLKLERAAKFGFVLGEKGESELTASRAERNEAACESCKDEDRSFCKLPVEVIAK